MEKVSIWNRLWDFLKALPALIIDTFVWLLLSFGVILMNIFIIMGMNSQSFITVVERLDITLCILTTIVCFLAGIIYMMYSNEKKRKYVFSFSISFAFLAAALSIVSMIQIEIENSFFSKTYLKFGMYTALIFSILLALISKYDETNIKDRDYGRKSREIGTVTIDGENFKL
jgi:hypothetical protein